MDLVTQYLFSMKRIATFIILFCSMPALCQAESVYVSDMLRVGVRAVPDNSQPAHGVVVSGMKLDVLEHMNGYIKIRSEKGVEGWIRDAYVMRDKPAKVSLLELQAAQANLQARLAQQDKLLKDENARSASLEAELAQLKASNQRLQVSKAMAGNELANAETRDYTLYTYALSIVLLVTGGFVAGFRWQRKQAMKQFGGLQV